MNDQTKHRDELLFEDQTFLESEKLMHGHEADGTHTSNNSRANKIHRIHCIINLSLTVLLLLSIFGVWILGSVDNKHQTFGMQQVFFSPALDATEHGSRVTHFNYTKWSPFILSDSNGSLDSANGNWTDILRVGMMSLSEEELSQVGGSPNSVRLPPESGGGYLAYLSSHHLLHCLYLLHQSLHQEYYSQFSVVWKLAPDRRLSHWDHCIETLRQHITCDADTTVITHDWYEQLDAPVPNQANPRRCANWDAHFQWQLDRQAPASQGPISKPDGATELPILSSDPPPGFMGMYNV